MIEALLENVVGDQRDACKIGIRYRAQKVVECVNAVVIRLLFREFVFPHRNLNLRSRIVLPQIGEDLYGPLLIFLFVRLECDRSEEADRVSSRQAGAVVADCDSMASVEFAEPLQQSSSINSIEKGLIIAAKYRCK